jgi:hypothetical protein
MVSGIQNRRIEHRNRQKRIKIYGISVGVLLVSILLLYLLFRSPLFRIKEFVVESSRPIDTERLVKTLKAQVAGTRAGGMFGADHYFAWGAGLHYDAPEFSGIKVSKKLFDKTLKITTIPRERFAIWCRNVNVGVNDESTGEALVVPDCYWIDEHGIAYEPALETSGQLILAVYEKKNGAALSAGQPVASKNTFFNIHKALAALPALNMGVKRITIDRDLDELRIDTYSGAFVQMSIRFDPRPSALPALKRMMEKPGLKSLEYVNLTVPNRAFYKPR